jgi:hypothetical protein
MGYFYCLIVARKVRPIFVQSGGREEGIVQGVNILGKSIILPRKGFAALVVSLLLESSLVPI